MGLLVMNLEVVIVFAVAVYSGVVDYQAKIHRIPSMLDACRNS